MKTLRSALLVLLMAMGQHSLAMGLDDLTTAATTGEQWFRRGQSYFQEKKFTLAIEAFTQSLNQGYQTADVYRIRSNAYLKLDQYEKALEDVNRSLQLDTQNADSYMLRAVIYEGMKQTTQAVADVTRAIELNPQRGVYYRFRGSVYLSLSHFEKAISDLTAAIAYGEGHATVYEGRGLAYEKLGRYKEAEANYSRALELTPSKVGTLLHRGITLVCLGEFKKAMEDFNEALSSQPESLYLRGLRAWTYLELENDEAALADLTYAAEHGSDDPWVYLNLGYVYYRARDFEKALEVNGKVFVMPDETMNTNAYFQKGLFLLTVGRIDEALKTYDEAIALAEGRLDGDSIDEAIEELQELSKSTEQQRVLVQGILKRLDQVRITVLPQIKPTQRTCGKIAI
jgi:tetratricopeptide (TPR) repeat protein